MNLDEVILAEQSVVGECIYAPHSVRLAAAVVAPEDFNDMRLGALYGLIAGMVTAGGPEAVTNLTVFNEINRRNAEPAAKGKPRTMLPSAGDVATLATSVIPGDIQRHAAIVRDAAVKRSLAAFGRRIVQAAESGQAAGVLAAQAADEAKEIRDGSRQAKLRARLLADVFADDDPGYDWLIPGLLERADRLVYTGAEGAGKSTFGRQVALCAAAGIHPFKREYFTPVSVAVVDVENSEKQWRRKARSISLAVKQITGVDPAERVHLACHGRIDITKPNDIGAIHSLLDDYEPDLLLIGPLYKLVTGAITNDDDAAPVLAALDSIRERRDGPALMMEAHAGHAVGKGGERDYRPRGSSALLGWPEFGFGFAPDTEDQNRINVIRWRGDRDERDWPAAMRRGGALPWTNDAIEPSKDPHRQPYAQPYPTALDGAA